MSELYRGGKALKHNHSSAIPRHIISVAVLSEMEQCKNGTVHNTHKFRCGHFTASRLVGASSVGRTSNLIDSPSTFDLLTKCYTRGRQTTWVVGYNVLNCFRLLKCPELLENATWSVDWPRTKRNKESSNANNSSSPGLTVITNPPTIIACRVLATQGRIVFVDIANWFGKGLRELAESIGSPYKQEPKFTDDITVCRTYCDWLDSLIHDTFVELIRYCQMNEMGLFRYTVAGQAMSYFRHKCMTHPIYYHDDPSVKEFERRGYYGGRTEVFKMGAINETVYKLDVSSFYPSIMRSNAYPYTIDEYELSEEYKPHRDNSELKYCIAEALIETKRPIYPMKVGIGNYYCTGRFTTVLAGPELDAAWRFGDLKGVRCWTKYKLAPLFARYVDECWRLRREAKDCGNYLYSEFAKALGNSLYGKFAQLASRWEYRPDKEPVMPWTEWIELDFTTKQTIHYRSFGWSTQQEVGKQEKDGTFPAISAFVTSYGRLYMNYIRAVAGVSNVLYQGVDSVIVTHEGYRQLNNAGLIDNQQFGKLRVAGVTYFGELRGCADYTFGSELVCAGIPGKINIEDESMNTVQRYWSKRGLFTDKGVQPLTSTPHNFHEHNSKFKRRYFADGSSEPYTSDELTRVLESAGVAS